MAAMSRRTQSPDSHCPENPARPLFKALDPSVNTTLGEASVNMTSMSSSVRLWSFEAATRSRALSVNISLIRSYGSLIGILANAVGRLYPMNLDITCTVMLENMCKDSKPRILL